MATQTAQGGLSKELITGILITNLLCAIAVYLPIIGFMCSLSIPLLILFYRLKLGRMSAFVMIATSALVLVIMEDGIGFDLFFFGELLMLGFALGEMFELNLSIEKTVLYTCAAVAGAGIAALLIFSSITQTGIIAIAAEYISKNLELTVALYKNVGMSEENIRIISNSLEKIQYVILRILPGLGFSTSLFLVWMTMLMARPVLIKRNLSYPDFGYLNLWKVPESFVWGVIGCGAMLLIPVTMIKVVGLNGLIILMSVYFLGGIAIVSYFFEKKQFPLMLRFFLYSLIALQHIFLLLVVVLGFFDMWLNFRRVNTGSDEA